MFSSYLIIWYLGAVIVGVLVAWVTVSIFRRFAPAGMTGEYWSGVGSDIHGLLYGEEDKFWQHYKRIISATGKYVFIQLFAVFLAFAPLVIAFFTIGPFVFDLWDRDGRLVVVPETAVSAAVPAVDTADNQRTVTLASGDTVELPASGNVALCEPGRFGCFVLQGFGISVLTIDPAKTNGEGLTVIRTSHDDWNPLWPYLNDPEFLFFLSLSIFSVLFFVRAGKSSAPGSQSYSISLPDYVLTQIATRNVGFMRKLGDVETGRNAKNIEPLAISRPIFISGLARSGTTILLEKLASTSGVATHRYRDFPFIMTPIYWNRFLRLFGAKQQPSERPHKDKIKITRDSPEAFEEPIWQHFFPHLHDASTSHILRVDTANSEFADFFQQHLQKILFLREGSRYLSKGNYNLSRMEYLGDIFPDAIFVVPVRHPLTHVESLVRQHQLFTHYTKTDPKIPNYLRAVGHYEFGPQRTPIHISDDGAESIKAAWADGDDMLGYAIQWREIYQYVLELVTGNPGLAARIKIVRFEDLCSDPEKAFGEILDHTGLSASAAALAVGIEASSHQTRFTPEESQRCWQAVERVATSFGYTESPADMMALPNLLDASRRVE